MNPIRPAPIARFGRNLGEQFDFARYEEKARGMTDAELHYALLDIQKTLASADARDRAHGTDDAGWYRDEASVYRREQARRRNGGR